MGTQIVAVRKLLIDNLSTLGEFATVETTLGYKVGSKRRERCWTGNAKFTHTSASMRATKTFRDESGAFDLVILIEGIGLDAEATSARAVELGTEVEDWVATHANWDAALTGLNWVAIEGDGALVEAFNDKGSLAELTYPITYRARLT